MHKLKQKELLQLKNEEAKLSQAYRHSLDLLLQNQTIKILIQYSKKQLENIDIFKIQNINDYSPVSISRLIFADQLSKIQHQISNLPNNKCPLMHFLIIMLKIVKFPFQKVPYYLLGLKQMFQEIKNDEREDYVNFQQIESYMLGQVVNFTDETKLDTEFEIRFTEDKAQDFLMHDNGVKKIIYSNDLHKYIVLDNNSGFIKIYDDNMKIVAKFEPNKDKHGKKHPNILNFDYDEFGSKLGISQSDNTFSIIHLGNFLSTPSEQQFRSVFLNEIIYKSNASITKIYFLSMMNKWLCIDHSNEIWIYDVENYKEENQNYCKRFNHPNDDYEVTEVIQLIGLSSIAFVIHNEVWFYNESLNNKKWKKFSHCQEIKKIIYNEERSEFYLVGKQEKHITIFTLNKINGDPNKIWAFKTNQIITDFEVFPFHNIMLILDCKNNLKVYDLDAHMLQYQQNYDFIVKKSQLTIKLVKNSKTRFLIHATYILCMELKKVAIERDMQFSFQDMFHYDSNKEEIIFSVNGQIIGISLMHGQIRKNVAVENSNIDKHKAFYLGKNTDLFLIDEQDSLYQILNKNDSRYKELKSYRKKVGIQGMKKSFYDEEHRMVIMISESSVYMVRNDSQNNFTFKSCLLLQNAPHFIKYKYYRKTKELLFLDSTNTVYLMKSYNFQIRKIIELKIFKEENEGQKMIVDIEYEEDLQVLMVLTNNGQFAIFSIDDPSKGEFIKVKDLLPYQLQSNTFTTFTYQKGSYHNHKHFSSRIFFYNHTGLLIEFQIETMIHQISHKKQIQDQYLKATYIKDTHQINFLTLKQNIYPIQFKLQKSQIYQFDQKNVTFIKAHDKKIVHCQKIFLQYFTLLTIGQDGHIKLWGNNRKIYFDLKIPHLVKIQWNMNEIHQKRNLKIVNETVDFLQKISETIKKNEQKSILHIDLRKRLKHKSQKIKINHENPIHIEFENKDLEEIVLNKKDLTGQFMTIDFVKKQRGFDTKRFNLTQRISEPWKKRKQFQQLYQKASPVDKYVHKYQQKMPFDLQLMRNDLHMDKVFSQRKNNPKKHEDSLVILPELKQYLKNKQIQDLQQKKVLNPEQKKQQDTHQLNTLQQENKFESCLFVKTERGPKKNNAFDEIDKYFWRKEQNLINKRWIPNRRNLSKNSQTLQQKSQSTFSTGQNRKVDPLRQVMKIFEEHNKEVINEKKGRLINIPHLSGQNRQIKKKKV